jgi:uncharacterized protein
MSEAHKKVARDYFRALGSGDVDLFKSTISDDYFAQVSGYCKLSGRHDRDQVLAFVASVPEVTKSGINFEIKSITAEEDRVACETQGRSVMANGAEYNNDYLHLFRFRDGKIYQVTEYMDTKLAEDVLLPQAGEAHPTESAAAAT